jgi:hypothetical protein
VSTAEPLQKLAAVIEETEARCPVLNLLLDAKVSLRIEWHREHEGAECGGDVGDDQALVGVEPVQVAEDLRHRDDDRAERHHQAAELSRRAAPGSSSR